MIPHIAVIDDDAMVRASIRMLLESHGHTVRSHANCQSFLDDPERSGAECLILDVRLPGMSGPELQERLGAEASSLPVIFVSGHATVSLAVKAMRLGAMDFLLKPFDEKQLAERVSQALAQRVRMLKQHEETFERTRLLARLSPRERDVLGRLGAGMLAKQIAADLGISIRTVEQHRASIKKKFGVRTLAELLLIAGSLRD